MPISSQITITLLLAILSVLILLIGFLIYVFLRWRGFYDRWRDFYEHRYLQRYRWTPLFDIIEGAQRRHDLELSEFAREMIAIPILEQLDERQPIDWDQVNDSVNKLVETTREERRRRVLSVDARSIIRSYWRNFCNIPPFCSPTEEL